MDARTRRLVAHTHPRGLIAAASRLAALRELRVAPIDALHFESLAAALPLLATTLTSLDLCLGSSQRQPPKSGRRARQEEREAAGAAPAAAAAACGALASALVARAPLRRLALRLRGQLPPGAEQLLQAPARMPGLEAVAIEIDGAVAWRGWDVSGNEGGGGGSGGSSSDESDASGAGRRDPGGPPPVLLPWSQLKVRSGQPSAAVLSEVAGFASPGRRPRGSGCCAIAPGGRHATARPPAFAAQPSR